MPIASLKKRSAGEIALQKLRVENFFHLNVDAL